jgi:hypothetical protein
MTSLYFSFNLPFLKLKLSVRSPTSDAMPSQEEIHTGRYGSRRKRCDTLGGFNNSSGGTGGGDRSFRSRIQVKNLVVDGAKSFFVKSRNSQPQECSQMLGIDDAATRRGDCPNTKASRKGAFSSKGLTLMDARSATQQRVRVDSTAPR